MADRGFQLHDLIAGKSATLLVPPTTRGKTQLTRKETETARQLSRVRIHVERVIGQMKKFRFLKGTIPISVLKRPKEKGWCTIDKVLIVCAAIINMHDTIVA